MRKALYVIFGCTFLLSGCSHYSLVDYRDVDATNQIQMMLESGATVTGTVAKTEPHQLVLMDKNRRTLQVQKSTIRSIKRKPPVLDDFGNGISEEDIKKIQTSRHTRIYGIGGGVLSFGISFFMGSMIGNASEKGGPAFAAATAGGTVLGTALFLHAGKTRDRQAAIRKINGLRRSMEIAPKEEKKTPEEMQQLLENERRKQEELRKERENLLKQLQPSPGNP